MTTPRLTRAAFLATVISLGTARADVPVVAVDIAPVESLVAQVMGDVGTPQLIVSAGASPHGYSLKPSQAQSLQDADIVFWIGASLTPWLTDAIDTLATGADPIELLELPGTLELTQRESALFEAHEHAEDQNGESDHEEAGHEDDEHDENHDDGSEHDEAAHDDDQHEAAGSDEHDHAAGQADPHAWLNPANAAIWLNAIAETLSTQDPDNADTYRANAAAGKAELDALQKDIEGTLEPVHDRNFIVFHDAYQYFENAFDFPASGAISISDAARPGPARLQEIRDRVSQANVTCVLAEPQFDPDLVETVLDGTEARSSSLDPLGSHIEPGAALYPQLMRELAQTLADCLR